MSPRARRVAGIGGALGLLALAALAVLDARIEAHGRALLAHPPEQPADAALVLGNRVWLDGAPNPCLVTRVDAAVALAAEGKVGRLAMSGGIDHEDGRIEADAMEALARGAGFRGEVLRERASQSTHENLQLSLPVLKAAGIRSVIVVSDARHLWRVARLARASGFDRAFQVQYAAVPVECDRRWDRAVKAHVREVLAVVNNAARGFFF